VVVVVVLVLVLVVVVVFVVVVVVVGILARAFLPIPLRICFWKALRRLLGSGPP
jgi:hypothetical protein